MALTVGARTGAGAEQKGSATLIRYPYNDALRALKGSVSQDFLPQVFFMIRTHLDP